MTKIPLNNFMKSVSDLFDMQPEIKPQYPEHIKSERTDREALFGDWKNVGKDIRKAMESVND